MHLSCRFGTAWAFWVDALVYSKTILHESYPFTYNIPGIVATLALVMMNLVSRDDLASMGDSYNSDEGSEVGHTSGITCPSIAFTEPLQGSSTMYEMHDPLLCFC